MKKVTLLLIIIALIYGCYDAAVTIEAAASPAPVQDTIGLYIDEHNLEPGKVYCLSSAANAQAITNTHREAHGLVPVSVYHVTDGAEDPALGNKQYFLDIHKLGPGNVTAAAVADAHKKDQAVQAKHGIHFVNYWVDEKEGVVVCLSQAVDSSKVIDTHKEAHGLIPAVTLKVKQGE